MGIFTAVKAAVLQAGVEVIAKVPFTELSKAPGQCAQCGMDAAPASIRIRWTSGKKPGCRQQTAIVALKQLIALALL